jgi:transposase
MGAKKHPSSTRYSPEMRERAVRMVEETIAQSGERWGVISRVARRASVSRRCATGSSGPRSTPGSDREGTDRRA